jgi:hypothetical protein
MADVKNTPLRPSRTSLISSRLRWIRGVCVDGGFVFQRKFAGRSHIAGIVACGLKW